MAASERIRVLIAGNVYAKRTLVRRFLEDDGYEVVGDVMGADAVLPALRAARPDAVVLDEDLAAQGASIAAVREAAPDARVIVFTATTSESAPPPGADGYLDKGVALAALTATLGRLFTEPTMPIEPVVVGPAPEEEGVLVGVSAASDPPEVPMEGESKGTTPSSGAILRIVAMAAGVLLIAWGVFAAIDTDDEGGETQTVAEAPAADADADIFAEPEASELDAAYATLDEMIAALEEGNYVLGTVKAQVLMDQREDALATGFATSGFDAEVTARLEVIVPGLPARVNLQMAEILGSLYPVLEDTSTPGGGSDIVLGETVTNPGGSTSGGSTSGGTSTDGGTSTNGGGGGQTEPQPGDGKVWGHSHKPPEGGWHGDKPPKDK